VIHGATNDTSQGSAISAKRSARKGKNKRTLEEEEDELPVVSRKKPHRTTRECTICCENLPERHFPAYLHPGAAKDTHNVCSTCWRKHLEIQVGSQNWDKIDCPQSKENLNEADIKTLATKETYDRLEPPLHAPSSHKLTTQQNNQLARRSRQIDARHRRRIPLVPQSRLQLGRLHLHPRRRRQHLRVPAVRIPVLPRVRGPHARGGDVRGASAAEGTGARGSAVGGEGQEDFEAVSGVHGEFG